LTPLFRRILVPHDFSEHASHALEVAAGLAARSGGRLIVLHALAPFYTGLGFPNQQEIAWTPAPALLADLRARLERLVARRIAGHKLKAVRCRVVLGDPVQAILGAARGADSIVMATVGRTGLAHLLIGSVAERIVRHAPVPVLTVRPHARGAAPRRAAPTRRRATGTRGARAGRRAPEPRGGARSRRTGGGARRRGR
jgi:universal stress protein A